MCFLSINKRLNNLRTTDALNIKRQIIKRGNSVCMQFIATDQNKKKKAKSHFNRYIEKSIYRSRN